MNNTIETIPFENLALVFILPLTVVVILYLWSVKGGTALYGMARMVLQLVVIGYLLTFIFETENSLVVAAVLCVMMCAASWISLRPVRKSPRASYSKAFGAIALSSIATLAVVTQLVLRADPWFKPDIVIPLAGMIFANSMNSVSLAAERFDAESGRGMIYDEARREALQAALIPWVNSLFAVGIVSLPGMMTGQILSGVPPMVAVRYQMMVMCMLFGTAGISASLYLLLIRPKDDVAGT